MQVSLPPDQERFVIEQLRAGAYRSADDLIVEALRVLRERRGAAADRGARRRLRGLLADLNIDVSFEEIAVLRKEMWANFPRADL